MLTAQTETAFQLESGPTAEECTVLICRTWEELEQYRESWNRLLQTNPASSIFQTPEWLAAWWQAFAGDKELFGLVFADAEGHALGIAPLYREQNSFLGRTFTTLRMVGAGSGDSDALDFITSPGSEEVCAEAFVAWLSQQKDWDVCALETLPQNSLVAKRLGTRLHEDGWSVDTTLTPNFVVDLPAAWQQYLNALESSFRPLLTRYPKRLQSRYSVRIRRSEGAEDLKDHLDILFQLHQMRWTSGASRARLPAQTAGTSTSGWLLHSYSADGSSSGCWNWMERSWARNSAFVTTILFPCSRKAFIPNTRQKKSGTRCARTCWKR